jgi:hypothetical protein
MVQRVLYKGRVNLYPLNGKVKCFGFGEELRRIAADVRLNLSLRSGRRLQPLRVLCNKVIALLQVTIRDGMVEFKQPCRGTTRRAQDVTVRKIK